MIKTQNNFKVEADKVFVEIVRKDSADDKKVSGYEAMVYHKMEFDVAAIPRELKDGDKLTSLAAYGLASLLQDRAASFADKTLHDAHGWDARDVSDARASRYMEVYEMLCDGVFSERKKGGGSQAVDAVFAEAFVRLCEAKGKKLDVTTATVMLQNMDKEQRAAIKGHSFIVQAMSDIRKEAREAASGIDLGDLLG